MRFLIEILSTRSVVVTMNFLTVCLQKILLCNLSNDIGLSLFDRRNIKSFKLKAEILRPHKSKFIDIDIKQHFCNTHFACKLKDLESYWVIKRTNWILNFFSSCDENIYFIYSELAPIAFQLLFISWIFWYLPK